MTSKWNIIYTKPGFELKVVHSLNRKKIINYCPYITNETPYDRKRIEKVPLFTSCVFVRVADGEQIKLRGVDGAINFLFWLDKPVTIPNRELEMIRTFIEESRIVGVEKTHVEIQKTIEIVSGREGATGIQGQLKKLILHSLGYILIAQQTKRSITVVDVNNQHNIGFNNFELSRENNVVS